MEIRLGVPLARTEEQIFGGKFMSENKNKTRTKIAFSSLALVALGGLLFLFQNCGKYAPAGKTSPMESLSSSQSNSQGNLPSGGSTTGVGMGTTAPPTGTSGTVNTGSTSSGSMGAGTNSGSTNSGSSTGSSNTNTAGTGGNTGSISTGSTGGAGTGTTNSGTTVVPSQRKCLFNGEEFSQGLLYTFYQVKESSTYCKDSEVYYQCVLSANDTPVWKYVSHRGGLQSTEIASKFKSCTTQSDYGKCAVTGAGTSVAFSASSEPNSTTAGKKGHYFFYGYRSSNGDLFGYTPNAWISGENFPLQIVNNIPFFVGTGDGVSHWRRYEGKDPGASIEQAESTAWTLMSNPTIERAFLQLNFSIPNTDVYPTFQGVEIRYGYGLGNTKVESFLEMEKSKRFISCGTL